MTITKPEERLARLAGGHRSRILVAPSLTASWLGLSQHADADGVTFQLRIPGYRRRDVSVELRDRLLIARGERTDGWFKRRSKKSFLHTFKLPEELDEHDVCASFGGEVLQLKVAKKPYARQRLIPIRVPEAAQPAPKRTTDVTPLKRVSGWCHELSQRMSALLALNTAGERGS